MHLLKALLTFTSLLGCALAAPLDLTGETSAAPGAAIEESHEEQLSRALLQVSYPPLYPPSPFLGNVDPEDINESRERDVNVGLSMANSTGADRFQNDIGCDGATGANACDNILPIQYIPSANRRALLNANEYVQDMLQDAASGLAEAASLIAVSRADNDDGTVTMDLRVRTRYPEGTSAEEMDDDVSTVSGAIENGLRSNLENDDQYFVDLSSISSVPDSASSMVRASLFLLVSIVGAVVLMS